MSRVELVQPTAVLRDSYRDLVADFVSSGEPFVPFVLGFEKHDFDAFLQRMDSKNTCLLVGQQFNVIG